MAGYACDLSAEGKSSTNVFVLYLRGHFGLRCRMVGVRSKSTKIEFPTRIGKADSDMSTEKIGSSGHRIIGPSEKQNPNRFTAGNAGSAENGKISPRRHGDTEERQGLPLMNTDDTDREEMEEANGSLTNAE